MKICFATQQYGNIRSGVGNYATFLINTLASIGHNITVICPDDSVITKNENIRFLIVPKSQKDPTAGSWVSLAYRFAKKIKYLKEGFDLIHFTDARESLFYEKGDVPLIGTLHDFYSAIAKKNPFHYMKHYNDYFKRTAYYNVNKFLEERAIKKCDYLISVCKYTSRKIGEIYDIPSNKFRVIYNGIDSREFEVKPKQKNNEISILFIGGNFYRKGVPLIIKSSTKVVKKFPNIKYYIIGEDKNKNKLIKLTKKLDVNMNFDFVGRIDYDEIKGYFQKATLFLMPSLYESFAIVFLEAMASGTPVIAGNMGGTTELIRNGENGFLVDPYNSHNLAEKTIKILESEGLRQKFIKNGLETVKDFSIEKMVENTVEVYNEVIEKRQRNKRTRSKR